jgi:hypothetical protein
VAVTGPSLPEDLPTEAGLLPSAEVMLSVGIISIYEPLRLPVCSGPLRLNAL